MTLKMLSNITGIISNSKDTKNAVHIMGEMTFTFRLITVLKKAGIFCIAATTKRNVVQEGNAKISYFEFIQFREY
jgi:hypothetical protein